MILPTGRIPKSKQNKNDSHSSFSAERSEHYHTKVIAPTPKATKRMNPTKVLPSGREFPSTLN